MMSTECWRYLEYIFLIRFLLALPITKLCLLGAVAMEMHTTTLTILEFFRPFPELVHFIRARYVLLLTRLNKASPP